VAADFPEVQLIEQAQRKAQTSQEPEVRGQDYGDWQLTPGSGGAGYFEDYGTGLLNPSGPLSQQCYWWTLYWS